MSRIARLVAIGTLLCAAHSPPAALAQKARLFVPSDSVSVGDRFRVAIVVEHPESTVALFPEPARGDTTLGDLEILGIDRSSRPLPGEGGVVRDSVSYRVTTFALDSAVVSPQRVRLIAGSDTITVVSQALVIPVRSLVPDDAEDVRDLAPIVPFQRSLWAWVIAGAAILAAALAYYLYRRRRRQPAEEAPATAPPMPPYEEALQRLDRLRDFDLNRDADIKPFYVELSDIMRTYLERRAGFPALESTTRELVRHLEGAQMQGFPSTAVARVRLVLERADLVKFADMRPSAREGEDASSEARAVVEEVERATRLAESTALPSSTVAS